MAVTFDAATFKDLGVGATFAHTVTATGGNRALFVDASTAGTNVTGVTYAGVAMTAYQTIATPAGRFYTRWVLVNPATGSNNVVVAGGSARAVGIASSFTNVDQTTPTVGPVSSVSGIAGTAVSGTIGSTAATDLVLDFVALPNSVTSTPGAGQTELADGINASNGYAGTATIKPGNGGTVTMSETLSASTNWSQAIVRIRNSDFAPAGGAKGLTTMGAGRTGPRHCERRMRDRWVRRPSGLVCQEQAGQLVAAR